MKKTWIKIAFYTLTIAYLVMFVFLWVHLFVMNDWKIEKNIVKIVKEAEIVRDYENNLETATPNPSENVFNWFFIDEYTIITVAHWVNKDNSVYTIYDFEWNEYKAFLKEKDEENDIAYLELNKKYEKFSKIKYAKDFKTWDEVSTINFDWDKKEWELVWIEWKKISSSIKLEEGDSGSPLLNERNRLIWINIEMNLNNNNSISYILAEN